MYTYMPCCQCTLIQECPISNYSLLSPKGQAAGACGQYWLICSFGITFRKPILCIASGSRSTKEMLSIRPPARPYTAPLSIEIFSRL